MCVCMLLSFNKYRVELLTFLWQLRYVDKNHQYRYRGNINPASEQIAFHMSVEWIAQQRIKNGITSYKSKQHHICKCNNHKKWRKCVGLFCVALLCGTRQEIEIVLIFFCDWSIKIETFRLAIHCIEINAIHYCNEAQRCDPILIFFV